MAASPAGTWSPRIDLVFGLCQCDKENHDWREGLPLTVSAQVSISWKGLHPPVKSASNEKRILPLPIRGKVSAQAIGRYKPTIRSKPAGHFGLLAFPVNLTNATRLSG